ncbi:MAG TPA: DCC1-like thiol-disulfide oxidoreductase family protein [Pyrinomonadaceae bacterium]|nr:DCC1-like thiol-disulfide oxidoreductase family protein [Pyrinomonadaceae bacterium]
MKHVKALFELDTRSLALYRVLLGAVLIADLLFRASEIPTFYADNGVLPRASPVAQYLDPFHVSFHLASGAASVQYALFAVALLCALAFTFGFRTRLAAFLSWLLLLSLHNRNFMVLSGSDQLIRLLLFWSIFLPVGASYSLDRALLNARRARADDNQPPTAARSFVSVGSAAFILQICCVYLFSAVLKSDASWWSEGSALYYALSIDYLTTPLAKRLLQFPNIVWALSWLSISLEAVAPALLFVPRVQQRLRTLIVLVFMLFHLGMLPFLTLGTFPFVSVAAWAALLPSRFWEKRLARARRRASTTTIYYDGECGFCRRALEVVRTFLAIGETRIARAQDEAEIDAEMRRLNSWIVVTESGERKSKFDAFVHLCRLSPVVRGLAPLLAWRPLMRLGTRLYEWVARSRAGLGRPAARLRPERPLLRASVVSNVLASVLLVYVLAWNVGTVTDNRWGVPEGARWLGVLLRLDQQWGMFAPYPRKSDGWLVIPATLASGAEVDLFRDGAPVSWEKPARVSALFANAYRQKYMENLLSPHLSGTLLLYGQHLCRKWNAEHSGGETLNTFEINYVEELTPPPGEPTAPPRRISVWKHNCF